MKDQSRRQFLMRTGCAGLSAMALSAGVKKLGLMNLYAQDRVTESTQATAAVGYRALVCIFLFGGNDSNNMVIPIDTNPSPNLGYSYPAYSAVRQGPGLAIPLANIHPLNSQPIGNFGVHPSMPEVQSLFNLGKLAIVSNVGPLVVPLTRTTYRSGTARVPYQLFSHSDQQEIWQSGRADVRLQAGWGGRTADQVVSMNSGSGFPVTTSVTGSAVFGQGLSTRPLTLSSGTPLNQVLVLSGFSTSAADVARRSSYDLLRTIDRNATLIAAASDGTQESIDIMNDITVDPSLTTLFPNSGIGQQLKQIAKVMKLNQTTPTLNLQRQIFFASVGGFDTHQNELSAHTSLYSQLSSALNSFYAATVELGLSPNVTTFLLSDFGRTFQPSGNGAGTVGSDHGWGSHLFVMGDSVKGGQFYGMPGPNGTPFPALALAGPNDADNRGRWIPTTAVDQYGATLAKWLGVSAANMPTVFPNIGNFATSDLGFLLP
jgi:uncharacterized protein (DUF1501 family)